MKCGTGTVLDLPKIDAPATLKECRVQVALGLLEHREYVIELSTYDYDKQEKRDYGQFDLPLNLEKYLVHIYGTPYDLEVTVNMFSRDLAEKTHLCTYRVYENLNPPWINPIFNNIIWIAVQLVSDKPNKGNPWFIYKMEIV